MKLAALLAQYLYQYKQLDLPGLGTFRLDPSVIIDQEAARQNKAVGLEGVTFESDVTTNESPELIQYISTHTGKIRALASADLDSYLGLATQFLNIGKPFLFEGIGTLTRLRAREYEFTPTNVIPSALREAPVKDSMISREAENDGDYKSVLYTAKTEKGNWKKPAMLVLLVGGLGLAIWGGYTVYKRTSAKKVATVTNDTIPRDNSITNAGKASNDTINQAITQNQPDTSQKVPTSNQNAPISTANVPPGTYKFIFEVANKARAITRLKTLQTYKWNAFMETNDSITFRIYVLHPATPSDTAHLVDSFSKFNGKKVYID